MPQAVRVVPMRDGTRDGDMLYSITFTVRLDPSSMVVAHYAPSLLDADEVYRPPRALLRMKLAEWVASASAPDGIGAVGESRTAGGFFICTELPVECIVRRKRV